MRPQWIFFLIIFTASLIFFSCTGSRGIAQGSAADSTATKKGQTLTVVNKWEVPAILKEISGIVYLSKNRFACIQDETGTIFIFNTALGKIEKEIVFTYHGDFEGIALVKTTAYALRADGTLFEVQHYNSTGLKVIEHPNQLSRKENVEGLCYDKKHNRLLLAVKSREPGTSDYKGIYAFDLSTKKLSDTPVLKIDLQNDIWIQKEGRKTMRPSDLAIHPRTGDLYIIDGEEPKLLIMSANGKKYKKLYTLPDAAFKLPEGITFTPKGVMYISNEGRGGDGNILRVRLR
jgi:uncharacterized protein YjiK